jgi:hypothetical protein
MGRRGAAGQVTRLHQPRAGGQMNFVFEINNFIDDPFVTRKRKAGAHP